MFKLLKYILFAVLIVMVLDRVSNTNLSRHNMFGAVLIGALILAVLDRLMSRRTEGMEEVLPEMPEEMAEELAEVPEEEGVPANGPVNGPVNESVNEPVNGLEMPRAYDLDRHDESHAKTGLVHDHDDPQFPQLQQGEFEKYMMGFDKVRKVIDQQRYNYDVHGPGYYLMNNGEFSANGVPYSKANEIICASKLHDLYNQHNHNYKWSPHTHLGKGRGYLNWEQTYE